MDTAPVNLASDDVWHAAVLQQLRKKFTSLMRRLHIASQGAQLAISLLEEPEAQDFITTHASILDSSFAQTSMSEAMRTSLKKSDYIFSGIKTFHELNEAFPSLLDENGNRKPFEQFLNDVRKIDEKYNINYLRAEYNFCQQSANMAAKWEQFQADGDRYNLQYRTAGDDHVRPAHAALDRITLPPSHPFWEKYFPPNGWNCRCTVVQVRKSKYPQTPDSEVEHLIEATVPDGSPSGKEDMFRFNPGIEKKTVPDYNPYTIRRCQECPVAKGKVNLAFVPENELCQVCRLIRQYQSSRTNQRLTAQEFRIAREKAVEWADNNLTSTTIHGMPSKRSVVQTADGHTIGVGKAFFTETAAKGKRDPNVVHLLKTATDFNKWIPNATLDRIETGRHHNFDFNVYKVTYQGQTIEFKCKVTDGELLYMMKFI